MKRKIIKFKKLTPEILSLLVEKYPDGFNDNDIITFKNSKNQTVEAVEVKTEDTIYLVKVSSNLETSMADFELDDYEESEFKEIITDFPVKNDLDDDE